MILLKKFKVSGHSMSPKIREGDEVLVSALPFLFSKPMVGDIVAFLHFDKVFIKKIKKAKNNQYLMEGINVSDSLRVGWRTKKDIIGKVICVL